jgi:hypothetical protein
MARHHRARHHRARHLRKVNKECKMNACNGKAFGAKTSPDIFQRIMYELLGDIPNIQFYLDDILIT